MDLLYWLRCLDQEVYAAGGRMYLIVCLNSVVVYLALVTLVWQTCLGP